MNDSLRNLPSLSYDELIELANSSFPWHWEPSVVADRSTRMAVASDPDGMLLEACQRQDAGEEGVIDPFWATTWRAATGLDKYLDQLNLKDQQVLEVGCGTGHVGFSAAMRGAQVTLTDGVYDPLILVHLSTWSVRDRCKVERLRFGVDTLSKTDFPFIFGSDVTYLRQLWPELLECLEHHLAPEGEVYLSDPFRIISTEFSEWIKNTSWIYSEFSIDLPDDPAHPIRIMKLTRG